MLTFTLMKNKKREFETTNYAKTIITISDSLWKIEEILMASINSDFWNSDYFFQTRGHSKSLSSRGSRNQTSMTFWRKLLKKSFNFLKRTRQQRTEVTTSSSMVSVRMLLPGPCSSASHRTTATTPVSAARLMACRFRKPSPFHLNDTDSVLRRKRLKKLPIWSVRSCKGRSGNPGGERKQAAVRQPQFQLHHWLPLLLQRNHLPRTHPSLLLQRQLRRPTHPLLLLVHQQGKLQLLLQWSKKRRREAWFSRNWEQQSDLPNSGESTTLDLPTETVLEA